MNVITKNSSKNLISNNNNSNNFNSSLDMIGSGRNTNSNDIL